MRFRLLLQVTMTIAAADRDEPLADKEGMIGRAVAVAAVMMGRQPSLDASGAESLNPVWGSRIV